MAPHERPPQQSVLDREDDHHGQDDEVGDRGREAQVEGGETLVVGVDADRLGRVVRPAAGQAVDDVEDPEEVDGAPHHGHEDDRPQERQGDVPEDLPGGGAVHAGRLARLLGDAGQAGQHQQGHEGGRVPDVDDDERPQCQAGVAQPGHLGQADQGEQPVEDAEVVAQQDAPDEPDDDVGHEHRQQQQDEHRAPAPEGLVEEHGQADAQHDLDRQGRDHEADGQLQGVPEAVVAEGPYVVVQPDEGHTRWKVVSFHWWKLR